MTREEAIEFGKRVFSLTPFDEMREFCEIAVKVLEQQYCRDCISRKTAISAFEKFIHELDINDEPYNYGEMALSVQNVPSIESERCRDCISRRAIIGKCEDTAKATSESGEINTGFIMALDFIADYAKHLPSVVPERNLEKCGDCINRQEAIDAFETIGFDFSDSDLSEVELEEVCEAIGEVRQTWSQRIKRLPSVEPERKTGHWEYTQDDYDPSVGNWHCSECKDIIVKCLTRVAEGRVPRYKYCSNCGCRMIKPQESEIKHE